MLKYFHVFWAKFDYNQMVELAIAEVYKNRNNFPLYNVGVILCSRTENLMTAQYSIPAHLKANRLILHYGQPQLTWIGLLIRPRVS